jgi:hypothetical protein
MNGMTDDFATDLFWLVTKTDDDAFDRLCLLHETLVGLATDVLSKRGKEPRKQGNRLMAIDALIQTLIIVNHRDAWVKRYGEDA